jgi:hypothetical protein
MMSFLSAPNFREVYNVMMSTWLDHELKTIAIFMFGAITASDRLDQ